MNHKNILVILLLLVFALPNLVLGMVNTEAPQNEPPSKSNPDTPVWAPAIETRGQVGTTTDNEDDPEEEPMMPEELREQARLLSLEKAAEIQNRIQIRREERIGLLAEAHLRRIEAYGQRIIDRNKAAIERIESLIARLEKRMDLLENVNSNIDTTTSRQALAEAKIMLDEARQEMNEAINRVVDLLADENPRDVFSLVRENIRSLAQKIRQAHAKVVEAISLLRAQPIEGITDDGEEEETDDEDEVSEE
jgi:hypothetical protein